MAGAIGPGDWVEFVDASRGPYPSIDYGLLHIGGLYRVEAIVPASAYGPPAAPEDCFELVEFPKPWSDGHRPSWLMSRFRPVYRPNADIIASLKAPSPSRVLEDA